MSTVGMIFYVDSFDVVNIFGGDNNGSFIGEIRNDFFELFDSHNFGVLSCRL